MRCLLLVLLLGFWLRVFDLELDVMRLLWVFMLVGCC